VKPNISGASVCEISGYSEPRSGYGANSIERIDSRPMNQAVFAFRRYEDASLRYTGIESHDGLTHYGLYDTVIARD
jgi:hypothetical protein